ncbi:MAG: OmpA family protein [Calditrichaceae bacterium]
MKKFNKNRLISILILIFSVQVAFAQMSPKDKFFQDYEKLIEEVRAQNGEILSPENFKKAIEKYEEASHDYDSKKSIKTVRSSLDEASGYANRTLEVIKLAKVSLASAIEARDAALSADAPLYSERDWEEAEKKFSDATRELEDDDMNGARKKGAESIDLYKKAELLAIKNGILGEAREQVALAEEANAKEYCFHTLSNAQNLLAQAEQILNRDRYARDEAIKKAQEAAYQGRHAQYLAKMIIVLSKKQQNWENVILKFEEILTNLSSLFNYQPSFEEGMDNGVKSLTAYIQNLKEEKKRLVDENSELEEELNAVREREANYSAELQKKLNREKKIEKVKSLFTPEEAKVIYEGDNLIIRLAGFNFPSGQAIIQPEYFSLLTKIQRAINEFPGSHILIEGHTDSVGDAYKNKVLSEQRAGAVREYLLANMDVQPEQISHLGFGEERPIASNETREGKANNRRIDVVISLEN